MRHIAGADDKTELEREVLRQLTVVVDRHGVEGTEPLEVHDLMRGRGRAIDLVAYDVGEESSIMAL
jgi:hypothetical protein